MNRAQPVQWPEEAHDLLERHLLRIDVQRASDLWLHGAWGREGYPLVRPGAVALGSANIWYVGHVDRATESLIVHP